MRGLGFRVYGLGFKGSGCLEGTVQRDSIKLGREAGSVLRDSASRAQGLVGVVGKAVHPAPSTLDRNINPRPLVPHPKPCKPIIKPCGGPFGVKGLGFRVYIRNPKIPTFLSPQP